MFFKNLKEDKVIKAIKDIMSDANVEVCKCPICIEDVACYVLNRIPPYYIGSGRGILHLEKDINPGLQDQADIYTLITQAINIIKDRRHNKIHNLPQNGLDFLDIGIEEIVEKFTLNFPFIVGRVLDYMSLKPKGGIQVSLFIYKNDKYELAQMQDKSWQNPYVIPIEFEGYFTFWPNAVECENQDRPVKETVNFKLIVEDGLYEEEFSIDIVSDEIKQHRFDTKKTFELATILI